MTTPIKALTLHTETSCLAKATGWRHQMETFSALLVFCASQRPVTRSIDVFFDLHLNKRSSKPARHPWFETPSRSLWRLCNVVICVSLSRSNIQRNTELVFFIKIRGREKSKSWNIYPITAPSYVILFLAVILLYVLIIIWSCIISGFSNAYISIKLLRMKPPSVWPWVGMSCLTSLTNLAEMSEGHCLNSTFAC